MNVLILANNDVGLYKFRKELLEALVGMGHSVYVALPKGEFYSDICALGCHYSEVSLSRHGTNPVGDLKLKAQYERIIKEVRPDIVFTYTIKPNIYGGMACAKLHVPYVANITGLGTAVENPGLLQKITLTLYRIALRKAQTVFFQNAENEAFFTERKLAVGKHKMLPGSGVNLDYYQLLEYPRSDTVDFVFIARIMKEKGIDQYLDAAKFIRSKYPQTRFHICGFCEEAYEEQLKRLQENGSIVYHGLVKDMRDIYRITHCTIHPTYYPEGLSNVLLESSASGRPIITTNRSGCREVVDDGVNGFVVREKDGADLIQKIEQFLTLSQADRRAMGLAGRKKVEREFDRRIVVEKYLAEMKRE